MLTALEYKDRMDHLTRCADQANQEVKRARENGPACIIGEAHEHKRQVAYVMANGHLALGECEGLSPIQVVTFVEWIVATYMPNQELRMKAAEPTDG